MKRLKYGLLAAAMVASVAVVPAVASAEETAATTATETTAAKPPVHALRGEWIHEEAGWWYKFSDGSYAANEFISGWWLNKAGWWREKSQYDWMYTGGAWYYGNKSWMCGREYLNNKDDDKAKWWKIDGEWYYFAKDGHLITRAVVDNYVVGDDGAWIEGVKGQWRHGQSKGHEKDWWYAILDESGKVVDYFDETDGFVYINGQSYLFDKDGWLILDKIATYTDDEGTAHFVAIDKDGKLVDYTSLEMDESYWVSYDIDLDFSKAGNTTEEKAAALQGAIRNLKSFMLGTMSSTNATKAYKFDIRDNGYWRDLLVGKAFKFDPIQDSGDVIDDDGTIKKGTKTGGWSVAPENVYVELTDAEMDQLDELIADKTYTGTVAYDGTDEDNQAWYKAGVAPEWQEPYFIPVNNYIQLFAPNAYKYTVHGDTSLYTIFKGLNAKSAQYAGELKITVNGNGNKTSFTLKDFNVENNSLTVNFDGKDYKAYYVYDIVHKKETIEGETVEFDVIENDYLIFLGDVTKTVGYKLAQTGLVDTYKVIDSVTETEHYDNVVLKYFDGYGLDHTFDDVEPEKKEEKKDWE